MTQTPAPIATSAKPGPITTVEEAERAIDRLNWIMDRLEPLVVEETKRMRAGHLRAAMERDVEKVELARAYAAESQRVRAASAITKTSLPDRLVRLQKRHDGFRHLLQTNLTVLATAHAVSEGIIRGVSGELARKQAPSTYGANGRQNAPSGTASQPLAVSRSL